MKLKTILLIAVLAVGSLAAGGCKGWLLGDDNYHPIKYYSLTAPEPLPYQDVDINVHIMRMLTGSTTKMRYRKSDNRILVDDYNKWCNSPETMLQQYLQLAFSNDGSKPIESKRNSYVFAGTITLFEIMIQEQKVIIGVDYKIVAEEEDTVFCESSRILSASYTEQNPEAFAAAISQVCNKLSRIIMKEAVALKARNDQMDNKAKGKK